MSFREGFIGEWQKLIGKLGKRKNERLGVDQCRKHKV